LKNLESSKVDQFEKKSSFEIKSNPMTFCRHFKDPNPYLSIFHGDFQTIGSYISQSVDIKEFTIVTNVPYGNQVLKPSEVKSKTALVNYSPIQNTFRRFGRFLKENQISKTYVVSRKMQTSNPLSFERFSNLIWDKELDFVNGGMNVNMLKL